MTRRFGMRWVGLAAVLLGIGAAHAETPPSLEAGAASARLIDLPQDARPLWVPYAVDLPDLLGRATPLVPVLDGAFGASLLFLHEPGDEVVPTIRRDGLPLGVGHRWADDPWTVSLAGVVPVGFTLGLDRWGGTGPNLDLADAPPAPDGAITDARFTKGTDDAYLRRLSFRSPLAPWTLRFDFDELIDQFPEDGTNEGPHESRFRSARAALRRHLPGGDEVGLVYEKIRKYKNELPLLAADHQEIWSQRTAVDWQGGTALGAARLGVYTTSTDLEWTTFGLGSAPDVIRKLETTREGVRADLDTGPGGPAIALRAGGWRHRDDALGTEEWAGDAAGPVTDGNRDAAASLDWPTRWVGLDVATLTALRWDGEAGWSPAARVDVGAGEATGWRLSVQHGGRAPRLDERLTAVQLSGGGETAVLLPSRDLDWERLDRLAVSAHAPLPGAEIELRGTVRRQRDGIGWTALTGETDIGRWTNDLDLDGWTLDLVLRRAGRLWGLARVEAILSRRGWDLISGTPVGLPPESSAVMNVFWERRFFREDGILEFGYVLEHHGEMDDPWLPGGRVRLPAATVHHLHLGFRLVGADLGFEVRNLGNSRDRVSAAAFRPGQTNRWRLQWTFRR